MVITAFYAWATFRMMRANERVLQVMRDQNEASLRPYIAVSVFTVANNPIFFLRIANRGRTAAHDLRLELDRDFYQYGRKDGVNLRSTVAFQEPIQQLPPDVEIVFGLAQGFVVLGKDADPSVTPSTFAVSATYSYGDRTVSERTVIDLRPYHGGMTAPDPVATELKKLREEELKSIRQALERPNPPARADA
ncbi:MAG TPA: hypothetical protein VNJ70_10290 [Thermoanaerobaculia bacterium]|nr:hypothetical protein [Thermoanaerobaculia bacterium]